MVRNNFEIAQITAVLSFVIGTTLFALYLYLDNNPVLIGVGLAFIIVALLFNFIVFLLSLRKTIINPDVRLEGIKTCLMLLANIPISIFYFFIIINSVNF